MTLKLIACRLQAKPVSKRDLNTEKYTHTLPHRKMLPTVFIDKKDRSFVFYNKELTRPLNCSLKRHDENGRKWLIMQSDGSFFHLFARAYATVRV